VVSGTATPAVGRRPSQQRESARCSSVLFGGYVRWAEKPKQTDRQLLVGVRPRARSFAVVWRAGLPTLLSCRIGDLDTVKETGGCDLIAPFKIVLIEAEVQSGTDEPPISSIFVAAVLSRR